MDWILANSTLILIMAGVIAFVMAGGMGANDVSNAMGTSVGSKALTVRKAIIIAIIFEFAGAYLAGGGVTNTISKGIVSHEYFTGSPEFIIYGMMASLLAAATWLTIATIAKLPVSTTHTIVGAIVGFAVISAGIDAVKWGSIANIAASWVISPIMGGVLAFILLRTAQRLILDTEDPFARAKRYVPIYIGYCGFILSSVTLIKGIKHLDIHISTSHGLLISLLIGIGVALLGMLILSRIKPNPDHDKTFRFTSAEKIFAVLMIFTACTMAFAHGSSDVSNAIGPLAAIYDIISNDGVLSSQVAIPKWILLIGAIGIVVGLSIFGARVMSTVGTKITELTPSRGFAAELGTASTVVLAAGMGIPISTTHTLVGAVLGVGMARGISSINLKTIGNIFASWIITLPAGAILSIIFFYVFKMAFSH